MLSETVNTPLQKNHETPKVLDIYERAVLSRKARHARAPSVSSNDSNLSNSLLNKWGGAYGYNVPPQVLSNENKKPSSSLLRYDEANPVLSSSTNKWFVYHRNSSSGQDQMAWIQVCCKCLLLMQINNLKHIVHDAPTIGTTSYAYSCHRKQRQGSFWRCWVYSEECIT